MVGLGTMFLKQKSGRVFRWIAIFSLSPRCNAQLAGPAVDRGLSTWDLDGLDTMKCVQV